MPGDVVLTCRAGVINSDLTKRGTNGNERQKC